MKKMLKLNNTIDLCPIDLEHFNKRIIDIQGEIDSGMALGFMNQYLRLIRLDENAPIRIFIDSNGGHLKSALIICNLILSSRVPIEAYCFGKMDGVAKYIFLCCNKRYMSTNATLDIRTHYPSSDLDEMLGDNAVLCQMYEKVEAQIENVLHTTWRSTRNWDSPVLDAQKALDNRIIHGIVNDDSLF